MSFATLGATRDHDRLLLRKGDLSLSIPGTQIPTEAVPSEVIVGVRPEHTHPWNDGEGLIGPISGRAEYIEMLGRETLIGVVCGDDQRFTVLAEADTSVKPGQPIRFGMDPGRPYLFDASTGRALPAP